MAGAFAALPAFVLPELYPIGGDLMAGTSFTLVGDKALARQLAALSNAARGQALKNALISGALLVANEAKTNAPYLTGNLRRSIHVGGEGVSGNTTGTDIGGQKVGKDYAEVQVGTNVEYAARQEFGFSGADSLGRVYHQPAQPYLRPALESTRGEVLREIVGALRALLRRAVT